MQRKIVTAFIVTLILTSLMAMFLPTTLAQETKITSITPANQRGFVGDTVIINGTITTANSSFRMFFGNVTFGEVEVASGNATGYNITASFTVPYFPAGNYTIKLQDVTANINATKWFIVKKTEYNIWAYKLPEPKQFQEGDLVPIWLNVTGGKPGAYFANVTVRNPAATNNASWTAFDFNITTNGRWSGNKIFPKDFTGFAHTNYTGTYLVTAKINQTIATLNASFAIGLTNATQYNRCQIVNIKASGYMMENVNVWINIAHGGKTLYSKNVTKTDGVVEVDWTVPLNASYGTYTVKVGNTSSLQKVKPIPDIQNFTVIKAYYNCNITIRNLDNEPVKNVWVRAYNSTGYVASQISTQKGSLTFRNLEIFNYTFKAFWEDSEVGKISNVTVCKPLDLNMTCNLIHLKISVKDERQNPLRFIEINIVYNHTVPVNSLELNSNTTVTKGTKKLETNIEGIAFLNNTFINTDYILNATRYNYSFTKPPVTINLTQTSWVNITCPTYHLILNVSDSLGNPFADAVVKLHEWTGGLLETKLADSDGIATFDATFGKYVVKVFSNGFMVNESMIDLIEDNLLANISCRLFNLQVSIRVVDYFGQGIPNAKVVIQRDDTLLAELKTASDGTAKLNSPVIGGKWQIFIYIGDSSLPSQSKTLYVDKSATIEFKLGEFTIFAGFLLETSQAVTIIFLLIVVILFLIIFMSRRIWTKLAIKTEKKTSTDVPHN